jgi:5-methylthioadenosine/S-adenosylhomocysteine deaminase
MKADLMIIDLSDPAYMPFNNAARQLVFSESGRGVETTIVNGRVVMRDRRMTTVNEAELRAELADLMVKFRHDHALLAGAGEAAQPWLLDALSRVTQHDIGIERFSGTGTTDGSRSLQPA